MAGTKAGGDKVKNKMLLKNPNYYREIGRKGGSVSHPETRFFYKNPDIAHIAVKKGGSISKRGQKNDS